MFDFIKNLFKREEPKRDPRVSYVEVNRVPIKKIEPEKFNTVEDDKIWRFRYTDTNEIRELPGNEAMNEILNSSRPVVMEGFVK